MRTELEIDWVQVEAIDKRKPEEANNADHSKSAQDDLSICLEGSKVFPFIAPEFSSSIDLDPRLFQVACEPYPLTSESRQKIITVPIDK